jgi:hypothetical protein
VAKDKTQSRHKTAVKPFGWQGLRLNIPVHWDVGLLEGHREKGFARIDDPEMARLELRWQFGSARFDIDDALDRYFKALSKSYKKSGTEIVVKPRGSIGPDRPGMVTRGFAWHSDHKAIGCITFNQDTRRVVIAQALVEPSEYGDEAMARQAMASLCDGPDGDDMHTWAVYDFACCVLAEFRLVQHSLKTGAFQLCFESGRGQLAVYRWALAELLLAKHGGDLVKWWRSGLKRSERRRRDDVREIELAGHSVIQVVRNRPHLLSMVKRASVFLWHCPESNQLVRVDVTPGRKKHWDDLVDHGWTVACHQAEA